MLYFIFYKRPRISETKNFPYSKTNAAYSVCYSEPENPMCMTINWHCYHHTEQKTLIFLCQ